MALIESRDALEGGNVAVRLPGVQKGDMASRNFKPEVNVYSVRFSPTAQSWAAATTEGLLIYSLDRGIVFDPLNLSLEVTPKKARECLQEQEYSTALLMALKLNETKLIEEIIEQIPYNDSKYFLIEFSNLIATNLILMLCFQLIWSLRHYLIFTLKDFLNLWVNRSTPVNT